MFTYICTRTNFKYSQNDYRNWNCINYEKDSSIESELNTVYTYDLTNIKIRVRLPYTMDDKLIFALAVRDNERFLSFMM